jgi:hypothetical protein
MRPEHVDAKGIARMVRILASIALCVTSLLSASLPVSGATAAMTVPQWETLWNAVLVRYVDQQGRIDFSGLARDSGDLDRVVAFIAETSPSSQSQLFPDRNSKLAFYINAYNALAMYGVVHTGIPENLGGLRKFSFFYLQKFTIGGKSISLYDFENDVIRPMGDERIHFALNCMVVGCPRLPRTAFDGAALDSQLEVAARTFVGESRNVRMDPSRREVRLSAIFDFYTKDFLEHAPSLVAYMNRYRNGQIPPDFKVRFFDYDWTVNGQRRTNPE